jgi:hypothetical protein
MKNYGETIESKFLGVIIRVNVKWDAHISLLANQISKSVGILSIVKKL